jgi:hypothetical protein
MRIENRVIIDGVRRLLAMTVPDQANVSPDDGRRAKTSACLSRDAREAR